MAQTQSTTAFQAAFNEWRDSLGTKEKSHKKNFFVFCNTAMSSSPGGATPDQIVEAIDKIEADYSRKRSVRAVRKVLGPVVVVLRDYSSIIDTLCQADPFPSALIWGSLKVIIEGLGRYMDLFEKIRNEVQLINFQLERLTWCEELWGDSEDMQKFLCSTYIHLFRFWSAVDKECNRAGFSVLVKATASFNTKKLQGIINELRNEVDKVDKLIPIVEARKRNGEMQNSEVERRRAGIERAENKAFREKMFKEQEAAENDRCYRDIDSWLTKRANNHGNTKRHQDNLFNRSGDTCDWILKEAWFLNWTSGSPVASPPVVWLHGPPGCGKSTLCSHAIAHTVSLPNSPAVVFQFFTFDQECLPRQLLYNIVGQLFDHYRSHKKTVPKNLQGVSFNSAGDDTKASLRLIREMMKGISVLYLFLDGLDEEDISGKETDVSQITKVAMDLVEANPGQIRVWFSTQDRAKIRNRLQQFALPDTQIQTKQAVDKYLTQALPGLEDLHLDEATQNWALDELKERANGHFLWATLMVKQIKKSIPSVAHLKDFITNGLPQNLDGYYKRILTRYEDGPQKEYGAKALAIILFAKRRLTLDEIVDAVSIGSDSTGNHRGDSVFHAFIEKLLDPLVEIDTNNGTNGAKFCRLFHSTVKTFLLENTTILQDSASPSRVYPISEDVIALTCLAYLRQTRYSDLLQCTRSADDEKWLTRDGLNVSNNEFLFYSAKNWDKHLNHATQSPELHSQVMDFLCSTNFATTIQIQSLFVERSFEGRSFRSTRQGFTWIKNQLPRWLHANSLDRYSTTDLAKYYGIFIYEWNYFLQAPTCASDLSIQLISGEVDRCLWGMLGTGSFLAKNKGRYSSFALEGERGKHPGGDPSLVKHSPRIVKDNAVIIYLKNSADPNKVLVDGFASDGSEASIVGVAGALLSSTGGALEFTLESWHLAPNQPPIPKFGTQIHLGAHECLWSDYLHVRRSLNLKRLHVSFIQGLDYLRVGSSILKRGGNGDYTQLFNAKYSQEKHGWYFEDAAIRGPIIALVRRQKPPKKPRSPEPKAAAAKTNPHTDDPVEKEIEVEESEPLVTDTTDLDISAILEKEAAKFNAAEHDSDDDAPPVAMDPSSDEDDPYISSAASSEDSFEYDSADESWSEGSSDVDQFEFSANDDRSFTSKSSSADTDSDGSSDSEESLSHADIQKTATSYYDLDDNENRVNYFADDDGEGNGYPSDKPGFRGNLPKYISEAPKGLITVYDTSTTPPTQIFQYSHPMPLKLYSSSPVIHPAKSLVVWPLCYGDILFADFNANSYYTRRVRTTTFRSQHVFTKLRFSDDGRHLHIASIEAQKEPAPGIPKEKREGDKKRNTREPKLFQIKLSLFVTTHRLSESKTTRSPPTLVFRAKASVGSYTPITASHTPLSLTWSPKELYCVVGCEIPLLLRVDLFDRAAEIQTTPEMEGNTEQQSLQQLTVIHSPKERILLPVSSRVRETRYFPPSPSSPSRQGLLMIGSFNSAAYRQVEEMFESSDKKDKGSLMPQDNTLMQASPPSGVWLREIEDLGGWVETDRVVDLKDQNVRLGGRLDRKIERWDMEEDECICQNPIII